MPSFSPPSLPLSFICLFMGQHLTNQQFRLCEKKHDPICRKEFIASRIWIELIHDQRQSCSKKVNFEVIEQTSTHEKENDLKST
ncbi:hypothetical protein ACTXT7_013435 [Hymenolepis weldensis]